MGWTRRTLKLVFEAPEFEGLEVRIRPMTLAQLLDVGRLDKGNGTNAESIDRYTPFIADALLSWNVEEDDGTPVPATVDGLRSLDLDTLLALVRAWTDATVGVAPPLEPSSNGGELSLEVSLPMEVLSPSL